MIKTRFSVLIGMLLTALAPLANATDADDTTITITAQTAGPTHFISQLTLSASSTTEIKSIQFTITPKSGTVARALSSSYSIDYMIAHGYLTPPSTQIFLPVYGLYAGFTNSVTLSYNFTDGSSKTDSTTITTTTFDDQGCGYNTPTVLKARTNDSLSYDYIFIRSGCGTYSPVIVDSDGNLRWVSTMGISNALAASSTFYEGAVFEGDGSILYRVDLDGTVTMLKDYSTSDSVVAFHHNIDPGKAGLLAEVDTTSQFESTLMDVDLDGTVVKTFNMADIISAAMVAGGDDPAQFVFPSPTDWFHNNAATYNRADDSIIVSSRENFVICIDYSTSQIKWIFGDQTKKWFQDFPSLRAFAVNPTGDTLAPIGQHATSLTYDNDLLLFDDGFPSLFQQPAGISRTYSSPRKYQLNFNLVNGSGNPGSALEVYNYEQNQSVFSAICSSVYEDAPNNYLVDYAAIGFPITTMDTAQLLGLNPAGDQVFYYQYNTLLCNTLYNSLPIHLENINFPVVGPQALNASTRGDVSNTDNTLIAGFIITGTGNKDVALRVLGPSLTAEGVATPVANPVLTLHDSSGVVIATNDDWQDDPNAAELTANGLAPTNSLEAATVQTLAPGVYTVVASSADGTSGIGLVEAYDLSPSSGSQLGNLSTRGFVGLGEDELVSGFIVGSQQSATTVVRALGPSLGAFGITNALPNPSLTIYDSTGAIIASNDNWQQGTNTVDLVANGLAPSDDLEAALVLHPPAGAYTAVVNGAGGGTGVALLEVYDLDEPPVAP